MMVQSYTASHPNPDCFPLKTQLYILPVENISDVTVPGGEYVPIDKIMEKSFPKAERLYKELLQIWMVSDVWKEMGTPPVIKKNYADPIPVNHFSALPESRLLLSLICITKRYKESCSDQAKLYPSIP